MDLIHNTLFKILGGEKTGLYRLVLNEISIGKTAVVRVDLPADENPQRGGRKKLDKTKRPRRKPRAPLIGKVIWFEQVELKALVEEKLILIIKDEPESIQLSSKDEVLYECRYAIMSRFFDFDHFREQILAHKGISGLERIPVGPLKGKLRSK